MNDCCDWYGKQLDIKEKILKDNELKLLHITYCPSCNNINYYNDGKVDTFSDIEQKYYHSKYKSEILEIKKNFKRL